MKKLLVVMLAGLMLIGCAKKDPIEELNDKVDEVIDDAKDILDKVKEEENDYSKRVSGVGVETPKKDYKWVPGEYDFSDYDGDLYVATRTGSLSIDIGEKFYFFTDKDSDDINRKVYIHYIKGENDDYLRSSLNGPMTNKVGTRYYLEGRRGTVYDALLINGTVSEIIDIGFYNTAHQYKAQNTISGMRDRNDFYEVEIKKVDPSTFSLYTDEFPFDENFSLK